MVLVDFDGVYCSTKGADLSNPPLTIPPIYKTTTVYIKIIYILVTFGVRGKNLIDDYGDDGGVWVGGGELLGFWFIGKDFAAEGLSVAVWGGVVVCDEEVGGFGSRFAQTDVVLAIFLG